MKTQYERDANNDVKLAIVSMRQHAHDLLQTADALEKRLAERDLTRDHDTVLATADD